MSKSLKEDLKKLKYYAKSVGLKLVFKKYKRNGPNATWGTDLVLTIYQKKSDTLTQTILNLIHEFGHHMDYVHSGKIHDDMLLDALMAEETRENNKELKVDKSMRKLILEDEKRAASYRKQIAKELDLYIDPQLIDIDIALDVWIYTYYYKKGEFPTIKQVTDEKYNIINRNGVYAK